MGGTPVHWPSPGAGGRSDWGGLVNGVVTPWVDSLSRRRPSCWPHLASGGWRGAALHMPRQRQMGILVNRAPKQEPFVLEFLARWRAGDWRCFWAKLLTMAVPPS